MKHCHFIFYCSFNPNGEGLLDLGRVQGGWLSIKLVLYCIFYTGPVRYLYFLLYTYTGPVLYLYCRDIMVSVLYCPYFHSAIWPCLVETSCSNKTSSSQKKCLNSGFVHHFTKIIWTTQDGHLNPDFKMKDSPWVWTGFYW